MFPDYRIARQVLRGQLASLEAFHNSNRSAGVVLQLSHEGMGVIESRHPTLNKKAQRWHLYSERRGACLPHLMGVPTPLSSI
jgi:hypothetical protein